MQHPAPPPVQAATPAIASDVYEYDSAPNVPFSVVLRHWWTMSPNRPGTLRQYYLATAVQNTVIAAVLTLLFSLSDTRTQLWDLFLETWVISQCIGFCIHIGFDTFNRLTNPVWRAGLPKRVLTGIHIVIPTLGVFVGYSIAFALNGRNFYTLIVAYPRAGGLILLVGLLTSLISYMVMLGETKRLKAEANEAHSRETTIAAQKQASEAELRALQAQIEPHFLFNTLANVQALIDYEPGKAKQMLESFIEYLRATLDASRRTQASLGDEFNMLERYLQLMQVRMGARLKVAWEIEPALRSHPFTPLLLQPLVENAIKYGLEPKIEGGTVTIRAHQLGPRIRLEVQDDGMGLGGPSTARKSVREGVREVGQSGSGTGLKNVLARVQSTLGANATLTLTNAAQGCCASLEFDARQ